jgi:hypothetical protein
MWGAVAEAHEYQVGDIEIVHPVARPTMGAAANTAVYFTIKNGGEADVLIDASGPEADKIEVHESVMEDGVMKMQHLAGGLEVPAMGEVQLMPGGYHVMLIGVAEPLHVGDMFPLTLVFQNAGSLEVEVKVVDPSELGGEMDHEMDDN